MNLRVYRLPLIGAALVLLHTHLRTAPEPQQDQS